MKEAIWLVAGGQMQLPLAQHIKSLGYSLILSDNDIGCSCKFLADKFIHIDTFDIAGHIKIAEHLVHDYKILAAVTVAADCHETVANICKKLGLHGISPSISNICRHKNLTRKLLTQAGIPQPKFNYVNSFESAKEFLIELNGQGVIKATDNSASRGFARFSSVEDFTRQHFDTAIKEGSTGFVIMEEALNPRTDCISEQSAETLWYKGEMIWLNWVDRLFKTDLKFFPTVMSDDNVNWGVEVGHINPAVHSEDVRSEVEQLIYKAGIALGMDKEIGGHILKADIMLTNNGPVILEMTPRLSGGWDSSASTLARGANFQAGALQMALGAEVNSSFVEKYFKYKHPQIFASVIAEVETGAINCLGRKFSIGLETNREQSLALSKTNLEKEIYVL